VSRGLGERLNYCWRVVATGYNFAFFGIGGVVLALTALPLARLWPGSAQRKNERARQVIHQVFRYFVWQMRATGVISVEVSEIRRELHDRGRHLVIANHPTLIDVVLLISLLPRSTCVVKQALWKNPFLKGVVRATGYISNSDPEQLLAQCRETLHAGYPIIVFPEGTRTRPGQPLQFQRGAAHIAVRCEADIVPMVISCEPPMLRKGEPWYRIPPRRAHIVVSARAKLSVPELVRPAPSQAAATRRLNRFLQDYYQSVCGNA
jgi:1-acyl-sn-glycerol-3-phosphate acyltransferase